MDGYAATVAMRDMGKNGKVDDGEGVDEIN